MKLLDAAQQRYLTVMLTVMYHEDRQHPACFDSAKQFEAWQEVESIAHTKPRALPCRDCTNEYHSQMALAGRCAVAGIPRITRIMSKD